MKKFINDNFLLKTESSHALFNQFAKRAPIIDFHCHLSPDEILDDKQWDNVAQVWLGGDHYKWRAMRSNGVEEKYCTGTETSDREKFDKFAETMPRLLRNPIYHWTHLEMARFFGIDDLLLSTETADEVWERANAVLRGGLTARECMRRSGVEAVCTTDDPISDLSAHKKLRSENFEIKVLPTFRPDKAHAIENPQAYSAYIAQLGQAAGAEIRKFADLVNALQNRHDYFNEQGCKLSDNGLETVYFAPATESELDAILSAALSGKVPTAEEVAKFKSAVLLECAAMDCRSGWTRQLHIGALRNNNSKMFAKLGPDTGFDSIGEFNFAAPLAKHLDALESRGNLGRTILYNLHPKDNEMLATMLGNFQDSTCAGKLQIGSGWWFLDQCDGIKKQLEALSQLSLLSNFVGMVTDSRSFLSYPRHEYFRRILCNILGTEMEEGELPDDLPLVGECVARVAYKNAKNYFNF